MAGPGPKTAAVRLKLKFFADYQKEIVRLLTKARSNADESDDAGLLGGKYDVAGLLKSARDMLAAHIRRTDNPHQETIESIGSYRADYVTGAVKDKMPNAILPISTYGIFDNLDDAAVNAAWTFSGWKLTVNRPFKIILAGTFFTLGSRTFDLSKFDAPAGKTYYVYVRGVFGVYSYELRTDSPPESAGVMYIGKITCGANGITSSSFKTATVINTFRLSDEPIGSAIPVTKGTFDSTVKLPTTWNPN